MQHDCRNCLFKTKATSMLGENSLDQLSLNHLELKLKKGDSIIKQGTYSTNVIFLRTGLAKIHIAGPYNEQIVKMVNALMIVQDNVGIYDKYFRLRHYFRAFIYA